MSTPEADNKAVLEMILQRFDDVKDQLAELQTNVAVIETDLRHVRKGFDEALQKIEAHSKYITAHQVESKADSSTLATISQSVRRLEDSALMTKTRMGVFAGIGGGAVLLLQAVIRSLDLAKVFAR